MQAVVTAGTNVCGTETVIGRRFLGTYGFPTSVRRRWIASAWLAITLVAPPAAAQNHCDFPNDWGDIGWFRRCLQQSGREDGWATEWLGRAASRAENPAIVQFLLQAGADPHTVRDDGSTPLHMGAGNSNPVVTAHLLAAGADPNALDNEGLTPLHIAAASSGNGRVVTRLLAAGANPQAEANDGRTPLHSALRSVAVRSVVDALVQGGGAENLMPLQLAALQGDSATVNSLLVEGADPNAVDAYGWGSLHYAVPLAGSEVISALLAAGADLDAVTAGGRTALHLAAGQRESAVVSELVGAGADPNAGENAEVGTPLHRAAARNDDVVVLALLFDGAHPSARDADGRRPVDFARANDKITGSIAYSRLQVNRAAALLAGRTVTGNLQPGDGVGLDGDYYDEWTYSATVGQPVLITMAEDIESGLFWLRVLRSMAPQ